MPLVPAREARSAASPKPGAGWRALGWAGLLLRVPESWELATMDGNGRSGAFSLADGERRRLTVTWEEVTRRAKPERLAKSRLAAAAGLSRFKARAAEFETVTGTCLEPAFRIGHATKSADLMSGYSPASGRLIHIETPRDDSAKAAAETREVIASLEDQPLDEPARWAFFSHSFVSPAGLKLRGATLNLGDMRVWLTAEARRPLTTTTAGVRFVYPAEAALSRKGLEAWHVDYLRALRTDYGLLIGGWRLGRKPAYREEQTDRGVAVVSEFPQLNPLRPFVGRRVKLARTASLWTIHDTDANRLIQIVLAERPERAAAMLAELLAGVHWAARGE